MLTPCHRQGICWALERGGDAGPSGSPSAPAMTARMPSCLGSRWRARLYASATSSPKSCAAAVYSHMVKPEIRGGRESSAVGHRTWASGTEPEYLPHSPTEGRSTPGTATRVHSGLDKAHCPQSWGFLSFPEPFIVTKNSQCIITSKTLVPYSLGKLVVFPK